MTELGYSSLMKMHNQNAHITLGKQHVCPEFSRKEKHISKMKKRRETKGIYEKYIWFKFQI